MKTLHTWIKIWKISRNCQYIKSLQDFIDASLDEEMPTPIREEWRW